MNSKRGTGPPDDPVRLVQQACAALHACAGMPLGSARVDSAPALVRALQALQAQAYELSLRVLSSAAMSAYFEREKVSDPVRWLSVEQRIDRAAAKAMVRTARLVDVELGATRAALADGVISREHADQIARAVEGYPSGLTRESLAVAEGRLLEVARVGAPSSVRGEADGILEESDPEAYDSRLAAELERAERRAARDRYLDLRSAGPGRTRISGILPTLLAEQVRTAIETLTTPGLEGIEAGPRTHGQRAADALGRIAEWFLGCAKVPGAFARSASGAKVVITVDQSALVAGRGTGTLLRTGEQLSIASVEQALCAAQVAHYGRDEAGPVLTDARRFFTGKLRELLDLRDRDCAFPGCTTPPSWCDGHHVKPYAQGGSTTLDNGVLLCGWHHGVVHHSGWEVRIDPSDRLPVFLPPARLDPARTPCRNRRVARTATVP